MKLFNNEISLMHLTLGLSGLAVFAFMLLWMFKLGPEKALIDVKSELLERTTSLYEDMIETSGLAPNVKYVPFINLYAHCIGFPLSKISTCLSESLIVINNSDLSESQKKELSSTLINHHIIGTQE